MSSSLQVFCSSDGKLTNTELVFKRYNALIVSCQKNWKAKCLVTETGQDRETQAWPVGKQNVLWVSVRKFLSLMKMDIESFLRSHCFPLKGHCSLPGETQRDLKPLRCCPALLGHLRGAWSSIPSSISPSSFCFLIGPTALLASCGEA